MIIVVDFGSQTAHLIARRIKELGVSCKIIIPEKTIEEVKQSQPKGLIFSGGPAFVNEKNSPLIDKKIFDFKIPILGICYGQQVVAHLLGGKVTGGKIKEYGPAFISHKPSLLFNHIPDKFRVWMSHGDSVVELPKGFHYIATTEDIRGGAIENVEKNIYCVQFHPELTHTEYGQEILKNFLNICGEKPKKEEIDIGGIIKNIKETVGDKKVIMALSGGTDSFVAAALIARAIGNQLIPVHVVSGLMRDDALKNVEVIFFNTVKIKPKIIRAEKLFLSKLKNITDPEIKRKTIGKLYVDLFEKVASSQKQIVFLGQGTTYADFIHSKATKHAALIKSHHNVGGLPKNMKLKLIEPIRYFYTDQVRYIGQKLNLPDKIINQQPFPGPGFAVRIMGEVNKIRLEKLKAADKIVMEEIDKAGLMKEIFQYFAILTGANSTSVKGDGRFYGEVVAVRAYTTVDRMSADWAKIPYEVLQKISTRIVNEVSGVSRVVYDITTKPPATMEWE